MNGATESAVIVTVPPAEAAVAPHRAQFDRAASLGVPAHVTVLYPFMPPSDIDAHVIRQTRSRHRLRPVFPCHLYGEGWFGTDVLWLDPQPADQFRALTTAVSKAFPDYPPYGGEHAEVIPHLTVGHGAAVERLRDIEEQVLPHLPIRMTVTSATLWCGTDIPGSWQQAVVLPLG